MPRTIALLRAINVGGHTVKMDVLRQLFVKMGFSAVETYIASGNVIFESTQTASSQLQAQIETNLEQNLGFPVATFLRSPAELKAIAAYQPFEADQFRSATAFNIAFFTETPSAPRREKVLALRNEVDDFHFHGRELYWLCEVKQSVSSFSNAVLEKTLGQPSTLRGFNTIKKIAEKYASP